MTAGYDADVIVVGGGPAGSTASTMLARKGWRVLLFERERFPRDHIGESLLPASLPILQELGVLPAIEAEGFLKKWGATMVWGSDRDPWSWHFRETNAKFPHAYQVWRPRFDQILLENSAANGVDVRQGHRVLRIDGAQEAMDVRYADEAGAERTARARFVIDASGQAGLIGHSRGLRRADDSFQNLAVYAYYNGCKRLPAPDENNIFVESYGDGWTWMIPLHNGWMSVGAVADHRHGSAGVRKLGLRGYLERELASTERSAAMLRHATLVKGPEVVRDWSYTSDAVSGDGWVLAGDAACFIDPLFSSGMHLAFSSGVLAAAFVTTALRDRGLAAEAAPVYHDLYLSQYDLFRQLARLFYATNRSVESYFWETRRIIGADESLAPRSAFVRAVGGQPPRGYERAVIERGEVPPTLAEGIRALGAGRAERRAAFEATKRAGVLGACVPALAEGVSVVTRPVLAEGEFVRGEVLLTPDRPEGVQVSEFVAAMLRLMDGKRDLRSIAVRLAAAVGADAEALLAGPVTAAVGVLAVDGSVEVLPVRNADG
jgi:flavin-dependent dehydrogenase